VGVLGEGEGLGGRGCEEGMAMRIGDDEGGMVKISETAD
jgi:hypothetical protein